MTRRYRLLCLPALVALLLFSLTGGTAAATQAVPVTIHSEVVLGPFTGTWSATGGINDAGTLVEPTVLLVDNSVNASQLHITRVVTGAKGTFTLRLQSTGVPQSNGDFDFTGTWTVVAGTGSYAHLHGQGSRTATIAADSGLVVETLTGLVHYD